MNITDILYSKKINPSKPILLITAEEALEQIVETIKDMSLDIDLKKLTKKELEKLLCDFSYAVVNFHPEDNHQERASLLRSQEVLRKKCGLTDDDLSVLDFS